MANGKQNTGIQECIAYVVKPQAFMVPCAFAGFMGGTLYFGSLETDPLKPIMVRFPDD